MIKKIAIWRLADILCGIGMVWFKCHLSPGSGPKLLILRIAKEQHCRSAARFANYKDKLRAFSSIHGVTLFVPKWIIWSLKAANICSGGNRLDGLVYLAIPHGRERVLNRSNIRPAARGIPQKSAGF
jgi:hypothetical protein